MRLVFYINGMHGGGAERVMATVTNALTKRGHDILLVLTESTEDSVYYLNPLIKIVKLSEYLPPCPTTPLAKLFWWRKRSKAILNAAENFNADKAVSFTTPENIKVLLSLANSHIPVIVSEHTNIVRSGKQSLYLRIFRNILYKRAELVTVLTRHDMLLWNKRFDNVIHLPNPVPYPKVIVPAKDKEQVVLAVGNVTIWHTKGFDLLLQSWGKLYRDFPDWKLLIAGKYTSETIQELSQYYNDCQNYEFLGFCHNIDEIMAKSAVFCLSSRQEGLPMALLEAMSYGCACVAFDCPTGPSEIINHGVSGLLAKPEDVKDLTRNLRYVMSHKESQKCYSKNAMTIMDKYNETRVIDLWEEFLKE